MADLVNTIVMKADGTQAVTESARVAKSLADVGDAATNAGNETGAALGGTAKGTGDAANEVDTKTNRIIKQFQRLEVEAKVAGKSLAEAFQIKADAAGLSIGDNPALQKQLESLKNTDAAKAASALAAQNALAAQAAATKRLKEEQTAANLALTFGAALRHVRLGGADLHDDADARHVTVLTDDEHPLVLYGPGGNQAVVPPGQGPAAT